MEQEVMTLCKELSWYFPGWTEGDHEIPELAVYRLRIEIRRSPKQVRSLTGELAWSV